MPVSDDRGTVGAGGLVDDERVDDGVGGHERGRSCDEAVAQRRGWDGPTDGDGLGAVGDLDSRCCDRCGRCRLGRGQDLRRRHRRRRLGGDLGERRVGGVATAGRDREDSHHDRDDGEDPQHRVAPVGVGCGAHGVVVAGVVVAGVVGLELHGRQQQLDLLDVPRDDVALDVDRDRFEGGREPVGHDHPVDAHDDHVGVEVEGQPRLELAHETPPHGFVAEGRVDLGFGGGHDQLAILLGERRDPQLRQARPGLGLAELVEVPGRCVRACPDDQLLGHAADLVGRRPCGNGDGLVGGVVDDVGEGLTRGRHDLAVDDLERQRRQSRPAVGCPPRRE